MTDASMELVVLEDLRAGDRVWCRNWVHPYAVLVADRDELGPWVALRRFDGLPVGRIRYRPSAFRNVQLYRLVPGERCHRCGGVQGGQPAQPTELERLRAEVEALQEQVVQAQTNASWVVAALASRNGGVLVVTHAELEAMPRGKVRVEHRVTSECFYVGDE
jgi:hypothetical protein